MFRFLHFILFFSLFVFNNCLFAQISEGGIPYSFNNPLSETKTLEIPIPNVEVLKVNKNEVQLDGQFSTSISIDISTENAGTWTKISPSRSVWRLAIFAKDAKGLLLFFKNSSIPQGARLYAYNANNQQLMGAYTSKSITPEGNLLIGIIHGETVNLEYEIEDSANPESALHLERVDYVYKNQANPAGVLDFGNAKACNVNINCPSAANWQTQKRGVARILMVFAGGSAWCSGSLIANTAGSSDPYLLSAQHCEILIPNPDFSLWRFDFDYESADCNNPSTEPTPKSVIGCTKVAARMESDMLLLKLNPIPTSYNVWYNGWNRADAVSGTTTFIHHPVGDIKKFSADMDAPSVHNQTINWGAQFGTSAINTHWKVIPETGIYEPGSSGCPLFDANKRIIGQLHGGNTQANNPCVILSSFFGRFSLSWNAGTTPATRLNDWLDPQSTGILIQDGYFPPVPPPPPPPPIISVRGNVKTHWAANMPNVKVKLTNSLSGILLKSTQTDAAGNFVFDSLMTGLNYTITPERDSNDLNGVTTVDLLNITKHILDISPLNSPWKILSVDANKNNSVSTVDILEIRKTLLGINNAFPLVNSWRFFPENSTFADPTNPFPAPPEFINITNLQQNVIDINFFGVKMGDSNNSANGGF
jgi:lysyl endopeptidase